MEYLNKLNQLLSDIDNLEDFVKLSVLHEKIDRQLGVEILRLIKEAKNNALQ